MVLLHMTQLLPGLVVYRLTAHAEVHPHAGAAATSHDWNRPSSTPRSAAARHNYAYVDDDDDRPERYSDSPEAQRRRQVPDNDLEETTLSPRSNLTAAHAYRRPPAAGEPLSVISGRRTEADYSPASGRVHHVADVHLSLNEASV